MAGKANSFFVQVANVGLASANVAAGERTAEDAYQKQPSDAEKPALMDNVKRAGRVIQNDLEVR